jgi:hypothetical protein
VVRAQHIAVQQVGQGRLIRKPGQIHHRVRPLQGGDYGVKVCQIQSYRPLYRRLWMHRNPIDQHELANLIAQVLADCRSDPTCRTRDHDRAQM